jgi:hypothetical protein
MDITSLFLEEQSTYIKKFQFQVLLLTISIALILIYFFPKNYGFIIILIVFLYFVSNEFIKVIDTRTFDWNKDTYYKLLSLQRISDRYIQQQIIKKRIPVHLRKSIYERYQLNSLYIDSDLIHFLDSIKKMEEYSSDEFFQLLKGTNNILLIRNQMENYYKSNRYFPENLIENIEIAFDIRTNCINNIHNFIYTIPKTNTIRKYHEKIIERYTILINRHIDILFEFKQKNLLINGINTNSKLHYKNPTRQTKPFDVFSNQFYV